MEIGLVAFALAACDCARGDAGRAQNCARLFVCVRGMRIAANIAKLPELLLKG
jgi:hypothetical protein